MIATCELHPGLAAAVAFEEQRVALPVEVHRRHLFTLPSQTPFRPVIELNVHTAPSCETFPVRLDDEILEVRAPAWVVDDDAVFGYRTTDGDVAPLAGVAGNVIHVFFDLDAVYRRPDQVRRRPTNGTRSAAQPGVRLADPILGPAFTRAGRNVRSYTWSDERAAYARRILASRERQVDEYRRAVRQNDIAIDERTWQIRALAEKNLTLRQQVRAYEQLTRRAVVRQASEDHARIVRMLGRGLCTFELGNGVLVAVTAPVAIKFDGVTYEMGTYRIEIPLDGGRLAIHAGDGCTVVEGHVHPHVHPDGNPCLGNIGGSVAQLLGEGEHAQAIALLLEFLRSYNPDNPYVRLERWNPDWEDEDDRYDRCYDNASLSDCATCDDGDCPHREDAEDRCYGNTDTLDCIACAACERRRDAIAACRSDSDPEDCFTCDADCKHARDEEACFDAHGGDRCDGCDNDDCTHHPQEDADEDPR